MTMPKGHSLKKREEAENAKFELRRRADDLEVTLIRIRQALKTGNTKVLEPATAEVKQAIETIRKYNG